MKLRTLVVILLCILAAHLEVTAQPSAGGIVYGPKGAFNMTAPKGWSLDPTAGSDQGLPCVLYPEGATWDDADPLMYAKIASTDYEDYEVFVKDAVEDLKKKRAASEPKRIASGKTAGGEPYFINEYPPTKVYKRFERVAYVQLPKAVAYIVYSGDDERAFRKHQGALEAAVKSIHSMTVKYPGRERPASSDDGPAKAQSGNTPP